MTPATTSATPWMEAAFTKTFPGASIRGDFQWRDRPRRVVALFGPSGCGKTTLLRCLAGLERLDEGYIRAFGETWSDVSRGRHVSPQRRGVGFLFQDYMLFPHLTVRDNIAFGTPVKSRQRWDVAPVLERFQLQGLGGRYPRELSGGQQQRVALARVLAAQPRLLCLDEPLSALDGPTRTDLRLALRTWLHELQLPTLIVTHDAIEVQALAEDVIVMSEGRIRQAGPVNEVWLKPIDATVARIIGYDNLLPVTVIGRGPAGVEVAHHDWRFFKGIESGPSHQGIALIACIRAEDIRLSDVDSVQSGPHSETTATIQDVISEGAMLRVRLMLSSGNHLQAVLTRSAAAGCRLEHGASVRVSVSANAVVIVPVV